MATHGKKPAAAWLCMVLFLFTSSPVASFDGGPDTRNALVHYGHVLAILKFCDGLFDYDQAMISAMLAVAGADTRDEAHFAIVRQQVAEDMETMRRTGRAFACELGFQTYGENGSAVPGLLSRR